MNIGDKTRTVISKGKKNGRKTEQVVYKTLVGRSKGRPLYASKTKHEFVSG